MRKLYFVALGIFALPVWSQGCLPIAPSGRANGVSPAMCLSSDRFSDPLPLSELSQNHLNHAQPIGHQNLIYLRDELRVGAAWSGGVLSAVVRQSASLAANDGAIEVIRDISTAGGPGASYSQAVNLHFAGFSGMGLAFETSAHALNGAIEWHAGTQILRLRRLLERDLVGSVQYDEGSGIYGLHATSNQINNRLHFPFQHRVEPGGWGALFNVGATWHLNERTRITAGVEDLGRLQWAAMPQEVMRLSTDTHQVDANGYLVYKPLIEGHDHQGQYTTAPVAIWSAGIQWDIGSQLGSELRMRKMDGFAHPLPYTGMIWRHPFWQGSVGWLWHENAAVIQMQHEGWHVTLAADRFNGAAHARTVTVQWHKSWP